jgi:hypothetical protein
MVWLLACLVIAGVGAAGYLAGRDSRAVRREPRLPTGAYAAGYAAGREDAFSGFDGGWSFGVPYIVTLRHGGPGVTYRFARRWPMAAGVEYRVCGRIVCEHHTDRAADVGSP